MTIDTDKVANECIKTISEKIRNLKNLNVIVAGKTGVGKSTLINSVFREKLAETGMGKPVTTHMRKLTKKDFPLAIYDTRGFELGKDAQKEVKQEVLNTIKEGIATKDVNKAIHCIWYCINTASNRIEQEEIDWLRDFAKENQITQVPVIIILTQAFSKKKADELRKYILDQNLDVVQVVPVLAEDYEINDEYIAKAYGLDLLIRVMSEALPDELQDTLQNVQIASLDEKKRYAQAAVATATAAAIGECLVPIPLTDCAMLIPTQVAMIASITAIFGFDVSKSVITGFISATIGASGATVLGKTVVANLLKLIPGAGFAAGGAISSATAGILTTALGETYILIMCAVFKGEMSTADFETDEGKKKIKELFKEQLTICNENKKL
ncbi:MAG: 50S ribosome-binding GTPase [Lachnospiraceae bacterium]|nr:50S ribosome-binding GTPase [Lachnospiraceae bacterium]